MIYGYVRVSTKDQNTVRQISALMNEGIDEKNLFVDRQSGKDFQRKRYQSRLRGVVFSSTSWRMRVLVVTMPSMALEASVL